MTGKKVVLISIIVVLLMMGLFGCSTNKNVLWRFKEKEPYHIFFSEENNKVVIIRGNEYVCNDLKTGEKVWSIENILVYHTPTIFNNELIGKTTENNIARFDLNTGECLQTYNIDASYVSLIQGEPSNLVYFVSHKESIGTLSVLDISTGLIASLFHFKGSAGKPIIIGKDFLAITVNIKFGEGKIYFVNKNTGKIKWERDVFNITPRSMTAGFNESMFFVDMQQELKNRLVEVDMQTGNIINRIKSNSSEWFSYSEYVDKPSIKFDEENILLYGDRYSVYNTNSEKLTIITEIPVKNNSILNNGKIIYHDEKNVYSFDIKEETTKEIYKLNGKEVLRIFAKNEYVLLVLAKNVRTALANYKDFTYVMLRIDTSTNY